MVRVQSDDLDALDTYRTAEEQMTRPQAIRTALSDWLRTHGYKKTAELTPSGPATEVVAAMDAAIKVHRASKHKRAHSTKPPKAPLEG